LSLSLTYNSTTAQTVTLSANVTSPDGGKINEGTVTFTLQGTNLTAVADVTDNLATATLILPAGFTAGTYSLTASYADSTNVNGLINYTSSTSANTATLTVSSATVTTFALNTTAINSPDGKTAQSAALAANVTSANGSVNEGSVTFTLFNPNGTNLTATQSVSEGTATTTLTLPAPTSTPPAMPTATMSTACPISPPAAARPRSS
jgi:hypothetical protein